MGKVVAVETAVEFQDQIGQSGKVCCILEISKMPLWQEQGWEVARYRGKGKLIISVYL